MMKKRITLIFLIFFNFITLWGENDKPKLLEEASNDAACPCNCDKDRDLAVLKELYDNNGGANWNFQANVGYQDILNNDGNGGFFDVPNAGVAWDVDAPNAKNFMGDWHGVKTNQQKCVTELILWSGAYNNEQFNQSEGIGLTGELPASINQLCALERLMIPHNDLTGPIPAGLDSLCNLEVLLLHDNQMEGPLPTEIGALANLEHLSLHNNAFTGSLPNTYTNLTELAIFHAENNKLTGPIPADIGNLTKLFILNLSDNCLSGTVPPSIVTVGNSSFQNGFVVGGIQTLLLNNNKLDSLPDITAISLINGALFDVSGNHFTFDDIIPNISVLSEYADQTLVLDTIFCISPSDVGIRLYGGFDESVDAFVYGDSSIYVWTRLEDDFTKTGGQNFLFFPEISANSASNILIDVTNVLAPDLTLKVSNFIIKVPAIPITRGPEIVCANTTTPYYAENAESFDWTVSDGGTFLATGDSLYITWGTGTNSFVTATGKDDCNTTTPYNVTILPPITASINPPEKLSCSRTATTLIGASSDPSASFSWQNEQGTTLGATDSLTITTAGTYILIAQNPNSCEARDTVLVEEEDAIITSLDLIQGAAAICDTEVAFLNVVDTFITYRWNTSPADTLPDLFSPMGVGTYSITVTDANGCVAIDSVEVVALPNPIIDLVQTGILGCDNSNVTLLNTIANNGGIFQWKDSSDMVIGIDTFISITTPGMYSLTARNGADCTHTDTISVVRNTTDFAVLDLIQGATAICDTDITFLSVVDTFINYRWNTSPTDTFPTLFSPAGLGTYSITVTAANGCVAIDTVEVIALPNPIIDLAQNGVLGCDNNSVTLLNTLANNGATFQWKDASNAIIGVDTFISVTTPGMYSLSVINGDGCAHTDTLTVVRDTTGYAANAGSNQVLTCTIKEITLDASNSIGAISYKWFDENLVLLDSSASINITNAGTYTVEATNSSGCTATDEVLVADSSYSLTPMLVGPPVFCEGTVSSLSLTDTYTSYQWSNGDTLSTIQINTAGIYSVTVSDAAGCTGSNAVLPTTKPSPTVNITGNNMLCQGATTTLSTDSTFKSYFWNTGSITRETLIDTAGFYSVTAIGDNGCSAMDSIEIQELNTPIVNLIQNGTLDCSNAEVSISNDLVGSGQVFEWSDATGIIDSGVVIFVNNPGVYTLTILNEFGCSQSGSIEVVANTSLPIANAGSNQFLTCNNSQIVLDASNSTDAVSYSWLDEDSTQLGTTATLMVSQAGVYTLQVKNASGCMTTDEVLVGDSINVFTPEFVEGTTFCEAANNVLNLQGTYSQYQWSTGATTASIQVDTAGMYTVNVVDQNGCMGTNSINIMITPSPTFEFTGGNVICNEGLATLGVDNTFATYVWNTGSALPTTEIDTAGLYSVTVTDANACSTTASTLVTEIPRFTVEIAGSRTVCEGVSTTLNAISSNPNVTYEWSTGDSFSITGIDNPGTYTLTVTDDNGCTSEDAIDITIHQPPITFSNNGTSLCTGGTAEIAVVESYTSYEWSTGDSTQTISISGAGSYVVTVTDVDGCKNNTVNIIVESSGPSLPNGVEDSICVEGTTILEAPSGFNDYEWSTGERTASLEVAAAGSYQVTVTDGSNCTADMNIRVREIALPKPDILGSRLLCEGSSTRLTTVNDFTTYEWSTLETTETISIEEMGIYSVTVSGESGCTAISEAFIIERAPDIEFDIIGNTAICAGASTTLRADNNYARYAWSTGDTTASISVDVVETYSLVVTNSAGCTGEDFLRVEERSIILPQITGQKVICKNGTTEISADSDYASYLWSTGDTTKSIVVDSVDLYTLQVTNETGCEGEITQLVKEDAVINAQITGPNTFCEGTTALLGVNSIYSNYLWSTGDTTATINIDTSGTVTVTVINENGCIGQTMTIIESQAVPQPIIFGDTVLCEGQVVNPMVVDSFVSYQWDTGNVWDTLPEVFLFDAVGTHTVVVTDINGCMGSSSISISRAPKIEIEENKRICEGGAILLELEKPFTNYQWFNEDTSAVITVTAAGTYNLTITDDFGCIGTAEFTVEEQDLPDMSLDYTGDTKCYQESGVLLDEKAVFSSRYQYRWVKDSVQVWNSPFYAIEEYGVYTLVLEDQLTECKTSETIEIFKNDIQLNVGEPMRVLNCDNSTVLIDARNSANANHFSWKRIDLEDPTITQIIVNEADTLNAIRAGHYVLVGIDTISGCMATTSVEVQDSIQPLQLSVTGTGNKKICEGDIMDLTVSVQNAGNENYQYNWSTNSDISTTQIDSSGTYYVTVTNNACIGMDSIEIINTEKVFLKAKLEGDKTSVCAGEKVDLKLIVLDKGNGPFEFTYMIGSDVIMDTSDVNLGTRSITPIAGVDYQLMEVVDLGNNCSEPDSIDRTPFSFTIVESPEASEAMDTNCKDEETGKTEFNLADLKDEINLGTTNTVIWYKYLDKDSTTTISNDLYESDESTKTIYASVQTNDFCESRRVSITLIARDCSTSLEMVHDTEEELDLSDYQEDANETLEVYITNRWGDLVYTAEDYHTNGNKFKGENLPQGAYYIYMKRQKQDMSGNSIGVFVPYKGVIYLLK